MHLLNDITIANLDTYLEVKKIFSDITARDNQYDVVSEF